MRTLREVSAAVRPTGEQEKINGTGIVSRDEYYFLKVIKIKTVLFD
jgi:hypothetical protein